MLRDESDSIRLRAVGGSCRDPAAVWDDSCRVWGAEDEVDALFSSATNCFHAWLSFGSSSAHRFSRVVSPCCLGAAAGSELQKSETGLVSLN